ncbi:MAG: hypothetical protein ACE5Z5_00720 [Candidatus Bathyarchaeia archaeon]
MRLGIDKDSVVRKSYLELLLKNWKAKGSIRNGNRGGIDYTESRLPFSLKRQEARRATQEEEIRRWLEGDEKIPLQRSPEYCSYIVHSIETGIPRRINANVKNTGLITNLPQGCCVEVPCLVDKTGVRACYVGALPPQCAALNRTNISVQELGVKAAIESARSLAFQAILMDPLTSAVLTMDEIREMVDEMFEAEAQYLPEYQ